MEKSDSVDAKTSVQPKEKKTVGPSGPRLGTNGGLLLSIIVAVLGVFSYSVFSPPPRNAVVQQPHPLSTIIVSYDPLIIYIENFLSKTEANHLRGIVEGKYERSNVTDGKGGDRSSEERTSTTAFLPGDDPIVQSVVARAAKFQGFVPHDNLEYLQATSYVTGQEYTYHFDLLTSDPTHTERRVKYNDTSSNQTDRITTIFAILDDNCGSKCGTQFPGIQIDWSTEDPRWCEIVDCEEKALTVKPRLGNAVFWKNLQEDGSVHPRSLHAGLPLHQGTKIGLNIWTRNGKVIQGPL